MLKLEHLSKGRSTDAVRYLFHTASDILHRRIALDSNLVYTVVGNLVGAIISLIFWIVTTRILSTDQYGAFNYAVAVSVILGSTSLIGLTTTMTTQIAKGNATIRNPAKTAAILTMFAGTLVAFFVAKSYSLFLLVPSFVLFEMVLAELLGEKSYKQYSAILILQRLVRSGIAILLYFILGIDGLLLGFAIGALIFSFKFFQNFKIVNPVRDIKINFNFMMHSYAMYLVQEVSLYSDKLVIQPLFGYTVLGLYQFGNQVLLFASIIPTALYGYLLPLEASGNNKSKLRPAGIAVSIILSIVIILAGPVVINALFPKFKESILPTQIIALGIIPMTVNYTVNSALLGRGNSKPVLLATIIFAISQYLLIYFLGSLYGISGLSGATVIALSMESVYLSLAYLKQKIFVVK